MSDHATSAIDDIEDPWDEDLWDDDDYHYREFFDTLAEASAFGLGLDYGDEPQWEVIDDPQLLTDDGTWLVTFRRAN